MDILDLLQPNSSFSVNMVKNTLTVNDVAVEIDFPISFNCNWSFEKVIEVLDKKTLNASIHGVSCKDPNDKNAKIELPIYECVLLKTENRDIISVGFYRKA